MSGNVLDENRKEENRIFLRELKALALPVTLQCLLQSSFSVVDQVMTGQLGSVDLGESLFLCLR